MARGKQPRTRKARPGRAPAPEPSPRHRITVEAQEGSDTLASVRWPHEERPPAVTEVLSMLERLETSLSARERKKRATAFAQARAYVPQLAASGCTAPPPLQASFPKPPLKGGIRVDVNVFEGRIVPKA